MNEETIHYAGLGSRFLAVLMDGIILSVFSALVLGKEVVQVTDASFNIQFNGWKILIPFVYTLFFWIKFSATPGKMVMKLKIVDEANNPLTVQSAIIRYLGYILNGFTLMLGFLWAAFNDKKQGLHDIIAKTYVVKK